MLKYSISFCLIIQLGGKGGSTAEGIINTVNYADTVFKVIGWLAILFSFVIVIHFQKKSSYAIYKFFKELGISRLDALQISILCRKNWSNNVRLFMVYSIFATRGEFVKRSEWKQVIREFEAKYLKSLHPEYTIRLKNTFILNDENIKKQLEKYFAFLKEESNQKLFSIDTSQYLSLVANLKIEEGYIVPLVQINSLQERYNSDWSKILNQYVDTFSEGEQSHCGAR